MGAREVLGGYDVMGVINYVKKLIGKGGLEVWVRL